MSPSRIVKSAHRRAGSRIPLKCFAFAHANDPSTEAKLAQACKQWLRGKGLL